MRAPVLGWLFLLSSTIAASTIAAAGCGGGDGGASPGAGGAGGAGAAGQGGAGQGGAGQGGAGAGSGGGVAGAGGAGQGGGSGGAGGSGSDCNFGDDCGPGLYCEAAGCGAGVCTPRPNAASLPPEPVPVCGCDGNSYWNAEVAAWLGVPVMAAGACAAGTPCSQGAPCPGALKCNREVADSASCGAAAAGTCWGLPLLCDLAGPVGRACIGGTCELMCSLIQGQNPWHPDPTCP